MELIKLRILTFLFLFFLSSFLILYPKLATPKGVVVVSIDEGSACKDVIRIGSKITEIAGTLIKTSDDFSRAIKDLKGTITLLVDDSPRSCTIPKEKTLNITVRELKKEGLKLGVDVWGGNYYTFESKPLSQEILRILEARVKKYGLVNTLIKSDNDSIRIETGGEEEYVKYITETGVLEGRITQEIEFKNETEEFFFNDKKYKINLADESIFINQKKYSIGQIFLLDDVEIRVENVSKNTTKLSIRLFDQDDLTLGKGFRFGESRISRQDNTYLFIVPAELSGDASERYEKATKNLEITINPITGESLSKYPLDVFIDGELIASMPILGDEMGKRKENLVVWGVGPSLKEATEKMLRLKALVELKSLPEKLILKESGKFSSTKGKELIDSFLFLILFGSLATALFFLLKLKRKGIICLLLILMSLSTIVLVFGTYVQSFPVIAFFSSIPFIFIKGEAKDCKSWLAIFLFFVTVVGVIITKSMSSWVLNFFSIAGLIFFSILSFFQWIFLGNSIFGKKEPFTEKNYKDALEKLWISSIFILSFLLVLFFYQEKLIFFSFTVAFGLWINMSLIVPIFADFVKKRT